MNSKDDVVLVSNAASAELGYKVAERLWLPFTEMVRKQFADGELYHSFPQSISGKNLVIVGVTHDDNSHQEILDLISGGRYWNANSINVIIPFLATQLWKGPSPIPMKSPKGLPEPDRFSGQGLISWPLSICTLKLCFMHMQGKYEPGMSGQMSWSLIKSEEAALTITCLCPPITVFKKGGKASEPA